MAYIPGCADGSQSDLYCPTGVPDVMPAVLGLVPRGPMWDASSVPGTTQNNYWMAYATVLYYLYDMLCRYALEFFCGTVDESFDQWADEYDLYNVCDSYDGNLCAKVTALGGQSCAYFVAQVLKAGWVITCTPSIDRNRNGAGCFQAGCTMQGPTPVNVSGVYTETYPPNKPPVITWLQQPKFIYPDFVTCVDDCRVVDLPNANFWDATPGQASQLNPPCPVPKSGLGCGPGTTTAINCFIAGYWDKPVAKLTTAPPAASVGENCSTYETVLFFGPFTQVYPDQAFWPGDSSGKFEVGFGDIYTWEVVVDIPASFALQNKAISTGPISAAGRFMAGCTPVCVPQPPDIACILEQIAPAHTTLLITYIQP